MTTMADLLRARVGDSHVGLRFEDRSWTWDEVLRESAARAGLIKKLRGSAERFHTGLLLENVPDFVFWTGAAALTGTVVVGINPTRRGDELAHDIRHTDCDLIVTESRQRDLLQGLDLGIGEDHILDVDTPEHEAALAPFRDAPVPDDDPDPSDLFLLLFTSGSTGAPKAVKCSTGRLASLAVAMGDRMEVGRDTVTYTAMPLFHGNSLMSNWAPSVRAGATVCLTRKFSASGFLPDIRRFHATFFNYVGRALAYILATPAGENDADNDLRIAYGTEASLRDAEQFAQRFDCRVMDGYGSSEGGVRINRGPGAPAQSLGLPAGGVEVRILNPDTGGECERARFDENGRLLNAGEATGEIVALDRSASFEGYYNNPEAEAQRRRDGHFWTGDLGYRDEDGFFYFAGRGGEWLRVDSENFAAAPVERIVARFPGVVMCAVYAVPDPQTGDLVMTALEMEDGADFDPDAFAAFLDAQPDLGTKWRPSFVRTVSPMPLTGNNKINKQPLRAAGWLTDAPVWWRRPRETGYRPLTPADREELLAEYEKHDRVKLLPAV